MVLPVGRVFRLYPPARCRATPHDDRAPVQDVSDVGLEFWPSGSGWDVLMIQSALPAASALVLSNNTRLTVAAAGCAATLLARMDAMAGCAAAKPTPATRVTV